MGGRRRRGNLTPAPCHYKSHPHPHPHPPAMTDLPDSSDIPPPVPIPLAWFESNFNTRSRTEQLLRPELHNGLITQHDFDTAVDFFPGSQRYYSVRSPVRSHTTSPTCALVLPTCSSFSDCRRYYRHTLPCRLWPDAPPTTASCPSYRLPCCIRFCRRRYRRYSRACQCTRRFLS